MEGSEYLTIQQQLVALASFAMSLDEEDLKEFINVGQHSLLVSSYFHPTLNIMAGKQLQGVIQIARALLKFQKEITRAHELIGQGERTAQAYRAMGVEVEG